MASILFPRRCVLAWLAAPMLAPIAAAGAPPPLTPDPAWPRPLPAGWVLGEVSGLAVDPRDHVWLLHRAARGGPTPPVIEFDPDGRVVQGWGGPGAGYDWFENEHSIAHDGNEIVWLTGNGRRDGQALAFTADGHFVRQIGHPGTGAPASRDATRLGRPAGIAVDRASREVFVADGYANRRVIVFDSDSGMFKRLWGAYGAPPDDAPGAPRQFGLPVHCVHLSRDGLVYVCDRRNDRVQIFRRDGSYAGEWFVAPHTRPPGSTWDLAFSPRDGGATLIVADGGNERLHILRRADGTELASVGAPGIGPGLFRWVHSIVIDSHGRVFTGEVTGRRVQRWLPTA